MKQEKLTVRDLAQIAIVAAIYVALTITPPLNAISYGAYQFRIFLARPSKICFYCQVWKRLAAMCFLLVLSSFDVRLKS